MQRSFRLSEKIELPADTVIIVPDAPAGLERSCSGSGCGGCSAAAVIRAIDQNKFLAISPSIASHVVLDRSLLSAFKSITKGATLGSVLDDLTAEYGPEPAGERLRLVLQHLSFRNFFSGAERHETEPDYPYLHMYVTNRCNLRCKHCYMSSGVAHPDEIDESDQLRAIEIFADACPGGRVTFTGGEALLSRGIYRLMGCARELGLRVELFTNGVLIKSLEIAKRVARAADLVQISLDGATAEVNDAIRGAGSFRGITRAIMLFDEVKDDPEFEAFEFRVAMTLTATNADDIYENALGLKEQLNLRRRPEIRIGTTSKLGRANDFPELTGEVEELRAEQARIVSKFSSQGMHRMPYRPVNRYFGSCGMGLSITIDARGDIFPCSITDQSRLGNIRDADSAEVIRSVFLRFYSTKVDLVEGCQKCPLRYACGGICRIVNANTNGTMNKSACTPTYKQGQIRSLIARYKTYGLADLDQEKEREYENA